MIKTREGSIAHVLSTLEKYYEELLADIVRNPAGCDGYVVVTTSHELPSDAFRRITEVDDVLRTETVRRESDPESVADLCTDVAAGLPDGTAVRLSMTVSGTARAGEEFRRRCVDALRSAGLVVRGDGPAGAEFRVAIVCDLAGVGVRR